MILKTNFWCVALLSLSMFLYANKEDDKKFLESIETALNKKELWPAYKTVHTLIQEKQFKQSINATDEYGYNALHLAAKKPFPIIVSTLLGAGVNQNVKTFPDLYTPLHLAIEYKNWENAKILLDSQYIKIDETDWQGFTPLRLLIYAFGNEDNQEQNRAAMEKVLHLLLEKGAKIDEKILSELSNMKYTNNKKTDKGITNIISAWQKKAKVIDNFAQALKSIR